MLILGIETSCDDTCAAIVEDGVKVLANVVANQDEYHRRFGGVVPEIAARKHLEHVLPTVRNALDAADLTPDRINAFAATHRPGLVGSLIVGLSAAKSMAFIFQKPLIGINHLEAHAFAAVYGGLDFSADHIALVASGGHTSILEFTGGSMTLLGRTVDDAAGEAYDKVAKFMGLGYPGGPIIDRLAHQGDPKYVRFPRPMIDDGSYNFSFSGLKTAVMYHAHHHPGYSIENLAAAFQDAVIDVLVTKTLNAATVRKKRAISVVGGVAANKGLREEFERRCKARSIQLFIPPIPYCTDNAAMVAGLAFYKHSLNAGFDLEIGVEADSGLTLQ